MAIHKKFVMREEKSDEPSCFGNGSVKKGSVAKVEIKKPIKKNMVAAVSESLDRPDSSSQRTLEHTSW